MNKGKDTRECVEELCERFRGRGIAERAQSDAAKGRARDESIRKDNIDSYIDDSSYRSPKSFKSGKDGESTYMTSDDFAEYYRRLREPKTPESQQRDEGEYSQAAEQKEAKKQSKKERRLAIRKLIAQKLRIFPRLVKDPRESIRELIEKTNEGFPEDKPENRAMAEAKRIPRGVIPLIACVIVSLFLIVCSSVMVSRAKSDVARLEMRISELEELADKLEGELDTKNDMIDIRDTATSQYGMVGIEYVEAKYIYIQRDDEIELNPRSMSAVVDVLSRLG